MNARMKEVAAFLESLFSPVDTCSRDGGDSSATRYPDSLCMAISCSPEKVYQLPFSCTSETPPIFC